MFGDKKQWYNLGIELGREYRFAEALKAYRKALSLDKNYKKAWNNMGIILYRMGKTEQAIDAFGQAICIDPFYAEAQNNFRIARSSRRTNLFEKS